MYYGENANASSLNLNIDIFTGLPKDNIKFHKSQSFYRDSKRKLSFDIESLNGKYRERITGIDDTPQNRKTFNSIERIPPMTPKWMPDGRRKELENSQLMLANLRNVDLYRANLRKSNLTGADLSSHEIGKWGMPVQTNLRNTNFPGATLKRANLSGADFQGGNFKAANLKRADLSNPDRGIFRLSRLSSRGGAFFVNGNLNRANLSNQNLQRSNCTNANPYGSKIKISDARNSIFRNADMSRSGLMNADLRD